MGIAELVHVHRHRGDAGDGEVERRDRIAQRLHEGQDHAADAAVGMHPEVVLSSELRDLLDGVGLAVGIGRRGAGDHDGVLADGIGHAGHVGAPALAARHAHDRHAEPFRTLVEGGMGGLRHHDLGHARDGPVLTRPVARGLHGHEDALGAAGGGGAAGAVGRVQEVEHARDQFALTCREARIGACGEEAVLVPVGVVGLVRTAKHVLAGEVGGGEAPFVAPGVVALAGRQNLGLEIRPGPARRGEAPVAALPCLRFECHRLLPPRGATPDAAAVPRSAPET